MENLNNTPVTEFILLGFSYDPQTKIIVFVGLLFVYLISLTANSLFIIVTLAESRLHSPMYFFLCHLSVVDLSFSSVNSPTVLEGLLTQRITIIYAQCMLQMYISVSLCVTECFLLAVIAWDRYLAICNPLHYQQMMNTRVCVKLAIITWTSGFLFSLQSLTLIPAINQCGRNIVDHIVCESRALSQLTCTNSGFLDVLNPVLSLFALGVPLSFIFFTYTRIICTILRMPAENNRYKTFSTCGSHLTIVSLFYGTIMGIYMMPRSSVSSEKHKPLTAFYGIGVTALNPLIYTLRNKEVMGALKTLHRKTCCY